VVLVAHVGHGCVRVAMSNVRIFNVSKGKQMSEQIAFDKETKLEGVNDLPFQLGQSYFFRTVTFHIIGRVAAIRKNFLVLNDASWVADSGRFMNSIKDGELNEVEPLGDWIVNTDSITDCGPWRHPLPKEQK
jgi:hypothetical protein